MSKMTRLDRFLAQAGIGSRAEMKKLIRSGRILVNGTPAQKGEQKIDEDEDVILMDGKPVMTMTVPTVMMNKPSGVVSATQDDHDRTVIDLIDEPWAGRLFPVGRLDKDTEGLMILTSDGIMSHELLSPKKHVAKTYFAIVSGQTDETLIDRFREGLEIGEKRKTLPAELIFLSGDDVRTGKQDDVEGYTGDDGRHDREDKPRDDTEDNTKGDTEHNTKGDTEHNTKGDTEHNTRDDMGESAGYNIVDDSAETTKERQDFWCSSISDQDFGRCGENECCVVVSITEGKFHQIKRMFEAVGREVHFLKRIAMGGLALDPALSPGQYRVMSNEELNLLRSRSEVMKNGMHCSLADN